RSKEERPHRPVRATASRMSGNHARRTRGWAAVPRADPRGPLGLVGMGARRPAACPDEVRGPERLRPCAGTAVGPPHRGARAERACTVRTAHGSWIAFLVLEGQ